MWHHTFVLQEELCSLWHCIQLLGMPVHLIFFYLSDMAKQYILFPWVFDVVSTICLIQI